MRTKKAKALPKLAPISDTQLLTTFELSGLLQVNATTICKWMEKGFLVGFKTPGGHRRFRAMDVRALVRRFDMYCPPELK